jgi:hypothetical protein
MEFPQRLEVKRRLLSVREPVKRLEDIEKGLQVRHILTSFSEYFIMPRRHLDMVNQNMRAILASVWRPLCSPPLPAYLIRPR